jgi:murein tripeptide amidase MpaA
VSVAALILAVTVHSNFEGGSLGRVEQVAPAHLRCAVKGEADQDGRNRQANWYYFRLDGVAGQEITIDLVDLVGEYNYRPGTHAVTKDTHPVYSYDQKTWEHFESIEWDDKEIRLRLRFRAERSPLWIAHVPPYTNRDLDRLLDSYRSHPHLRREVIGKTVGGRDMLLLTVTNPAAADAGKKVAWLMFRQHSWETGASWAGEGALRFLLADDARALRDRGIWKIFPLADPDGAARGGVRFNAHGYDLNRNWDAVRPEKMPEIAAQRRAVLEWVDAGRSLDLFLTLHNTETAEYLEGPPVPLVERFYRTLVETTTFAPTRPPRPQETSTTPGKPGRMTVAQGLYHDRKIPTMIMEQRIDRNPKLGRFPTVEDRLRFGAGLVQAIGTTLGLPRK